MKKIIIVVVLVALGALAYMYRDTLVGLFTCTNCCSDETTIWSDAENKCVPRDGNPEQEYPATFSLSDISTITMALEDTPQREIVLTRDPSSGQPFSSDFEVEPAGTGNVVLVDMHVAYQQASGDVLIPYFANYGGSGSFASLGLFAREGTNALVLRDSYLLGDRIAIDGVSIEGTEQMYTARVDFRDRREEDAMAMPPTVPKRLEVSVGAHAFGEGSIVTPAEPVSRYKDLIAVSLPPANGMVASPMTVRGEARGQWYFEASFPITVVDWDGVIIGEGYAEAQGDWMTTEYVPFEGTITFTVPKDTPYRRGAVIFKKDNPSGLPEHDDAFELPVLFE